MEPIIFGIIKGEQPLIRASRASKVAGAFLVHFWHAKENVPGGNAFCKSHRTCPHAKTPCTGSEWLKIALLVIINKPVIVFFALE